MNLDIKKELKKILEKLRTEKNEVIEDMVLGIALMSNEILYTLDFKHFKSSFQVFILLHGVYETAEINKSLPTSLSMNTDEVRFEANITVQCEEKELSKFDEKSFVITLLGFTKNENPMRNYFSNRLVIFSGIQKIHLNSECLDGNNLKGIRQPPKLGFA